MIHFHAIHISKYDCLHRLITISCICRLLFLVLVISMVDRMCHIDTQFLLLFKYSGPGFEFLSFTLRTNKVLRWLYQSFLFHTEYISFYIVNDDEKVLYGLTTV